MGFSFKKLLGGSTIQNFAEGLGLKGSDEYGNAIGHLFNNVMGSSDAASQSYKYSQAAADADMARSIFLWNAQNAYNTPSAQIARLQAAGIDVNPMTYAVGNGSMSSVASSISAPGTGGANMSAGGVGPISALMSVFSGIKGMQEVDARIENSNKQTDALVDKIHAETDLIRGKTPSEIYGAGLENQRIMIENALANKELGRHVYNDPAEYEESLTRSNEAQFKRNKSSRFLRGFGIRR